MAKFYVNYISKTDGDCCKVWVEAESAEEAREKSLREHLDIDTIIAVMSEERAIRPVQPKEKAVAEVVDDLPEDDLPAPEPVAEKPKAAEKKPAPEKKESPFEATIRKYLEMAAEEDPLFAVSFSKPNKSIAECCKYIKQEAQKLKDGQVAIVEGAAVYGWAKHYYDEDDIVVESAPKAKVVAPKAAPKPAPKPAPKKVEPERPKERQLSIFDFLDGADQ